MIRSNLVNFPWKWLHSWFFHFMLKLIKFCLSYLVTSHKCLQLKAASLHAPPFPVDRDAYPGFSRCSNQAVTHIITSALISLVLMSILFVHIIYITWKRECDLEKWLSGSLLNNILFLNVKSFYWICFRLWLANWPIYLSDFSVVRVYIINLFGEENLSLCKMVFFQRST